jgi:hypothetical protein
MPRLIAFVTCDVVERDDAGKHTIRGSHSMFLATAFPTVVPFRAFVLFTDAPVNAPYNVVIEIRDRASGTTLGHLTMAIAPHDATDICDFTFDINLNVAHPAAFTLHLLLNDEEIGSTFYTIMPFAPSA